jgi:hypothetical protein
MTNRIDKFEQNILLLSESDKIEDAIKEWKIIPLYGKKKNIIREDEDKVICVCCRKIKHYFTCVNVKTGKFIHAGGGCIKRFPYEKINNKILQTILSDIRNIPVEYEDIEDPHEYSSVILNKILHAYKNGIIQCKYKGIFDCINMKKSIINFKNIYNINYSEYLNNLIIEIEDIISEKRKLLEDNKKYEREAMERQRELEEMERQREREEMERQRELEEMERIRELEEKKREREYVEYIRQRKLEHERQLKLEHERQRKLENERQRKLEEQKEREHNAIMEKTRKSLKNYCLQKKNKKPI